MADFDSGELPTVSGSGEAVKHKYDVYRGKNGKLWLAAFSVPNRADFIYVQGDANSDGFAGREIRFDIRHGDAVLLNGPWSVGPGSLFADTGIDLRELHHSIVVIGAGRSIPSGSYMRTVITGVVYQDPGWVLGRHADHRLREIGQRLANERQAKLAGYAQSTGGSISITFQPEPPDA